MNYSIGTAECNGFQMDYIKFGSGSKYFVMIPGISLKSITLSAKAIADAYCDFAEDYTVFVFDRRKNVQQGYSLEQMADDTAVAMRSIGISNAYVFGASQGGMISQFLAANHPDLVGKLVLGSTMSRPNELSDKSLRNWLELANLHDVQALNHDCFFKMYSPEFLDSLKDALPLIEKNGTAEECDRFAIFVESMFDFNAYDRLSEIKCPVLVLGAKKDNVLGVNGSLEIIEKLGCESYIYENGYHAVYDEATDYKQRLMHFFK